MGYQVFLSHGASLARFARCSSAIIPQLFFATRGICQSVICQRVKVCHLASKTASFNDHFETLEQTLFQLSTTVSVKGKHTFLIAWIQVEDTIYSLTLFFENEKRPA